MTVPAAATVRHQQLARVFAARLHARGRLGLYTLADVAAHARPDDAWIVVDGKVYDITQHVLEHPGWTSGCAGSQLLAILRTLGTDCTEEVFSVHSQRALAQFAPFLIGLLVEQRGAGEKGSACGPCGAEA